MKTLYLIGGAMGVGKTTVCQILKKKLDRAVFLDGDWCWDADPFQVTTETKAMVLDNIGHVLNNFLRCSAYENILFCWVLHEPEIWDAILSRLDRRGCQVKKAALVCRPEALRRRLEQDIRAGIRQADVLERSLSRLACYGRLPVQRLDVSDQSPEETAERILLMEGVGNFT